jgi:transcriptional regulator with XRE-family HTH domain
MTQPEIGTKICELRYKKNISQANLAEQAKVCRRTIQRIEHGDSVPRISTLKQILNVLDYDLNSFRESDRSDYTLQLFKYLPTFPGFVL